MNYLLDRLKEPACWRGLVMLATSLGLGISPEQANAIIAIGTAVVGGIGVFAPNKIGKPGAR